MISKAKDYWVPLLRLMDELPGGQGETSQILVLFLERYGRQLDPSHFNLKPNGRTEKWNNTVQWARMELVRLGYMDSPGRESVENHAESATVAGSTSSRHTT